MITCPVLYNFFITKVDNPLHLMLERCEGFFFANKPLNLNTELSKFDPAPTVSKVVER